MTNYFLFEFVKQTTVVPIKVINWTRFTRGIGYEENLQPNNEDFHLLYRISHLTHSIDILFKLELDSINHDALVSIFNPISYG